jgi:drug/metabolite transporter (DMT)-like permease
MQRVPAKAGFFLMAGMLTFGMAAIVVRFGTGAHPFVLAALRTLIATTLVWIGFVVAKRTSRVSSCQALRLTAAGLVLGFHFLLWTVSLSYTTVAAASVLVTSHPVLLLMVERFWLKRRFSNHVWFGVALAITGSVVLSLGQPDANTPMPFAPLGNFLAFLAAVAFVAYALLSSGLRQQTDLLPFTAWVYLGSAISCTTAAVFVFTPHIPEQVFWAAGALALGPQLVGHGSVAYAVKYFSPTLISTLILVEPLIASVLAYSFFGEVPSLQAMAGMGLILSGVVLTWTGNLLPGKTEPPAS